VAAVNYCADWQLRSTSSPEVAMATWRWELWGCWRAIHSSN